MYMKSRFIKILLVIISTYIIFYYTNLAKPVESNIDDGNFSNNAFIGYLINHKPGYVCKLGVMLGQVMLVIGLIQCYFIYTKQYSSIRLINLILLIFAYLVSFMNLKLQQNILIAFILQFILIILPNK